MFKKLLFSLSAFFFIFLSPLRINAQAGYVLFTGAGAINSTGATVITGDVGTGTGPITLLAPGIINGAQNIGSPATDQAKLDIIAAYDALNLVSCGVSGFGPTLGNGQVITPQCVLHGSSFNHCRGLNFRRTKQPECNFFS